MLADHGSRQIRQRPNFKPATDCKSEHEHDGQESHGQSKPPPQTVTPGYQTSAQDRNQPNKRRGQDKVKRCNRRGQV
jgi:hypothetical protein